MHVVIVGAGFGGLELSSCLSEELGDDVQVTLIDQNDHFVFGFAKLDVMFGRTSAESVRYHYRDIVKPGVEFRQETVTSIDPARSASSPTRARTTPTCWWSRSAPTSTSPPRPASPKPGYDSTPRRRGASPRARERVQLWHRRGRDHGRLLQVPAGAVRDGCCCCTTNSNAAASATHRASSSSAPSRRPCRSRPTRPRHCSPRSPSAASSTCRSRAQPPSTRRPRP